MPLESATYISDLNASNPAATDELLQGDDHIRLIKSAIKATFPNFTAAPLVSANTDIDALVSAAPNGASVLADAGANFKTNTTDGIANPVAGEVDIVAGGVASLQVLSTGVVGVLAQLNAPIVNAASFIGGGGELVPTGAVFMWALDTLPTGYTWANGAAISRTGANANLFALWGTKYGAGDGTTTFNVLDLRDVFPVGQGDMGGAADAGHISTYATTTLGLLVGEDKHVLVVGEIPAHKHTLTDPGHDHGFNTDFATQGFVGGSIDGLRADNSGPNPSDRTDTNTTGITMDNTGGGAAHNNVPPGRVVNFIIKL